MAAAPSARPVTFMPVIDPLAEMQTFALLSNVSAPLANDGRVSSSTHFAAGIVIW